MTWADPVAALVIVPPISHPTGGQGSNARQSLRLLLMVDHRVPTNDFAVGLILSERRHAQL